MLSDALVRTVSTQSEAVDGQRCGQARLGEIKMLSGNRESDSA